MAVAYLVFIAITAAGPALPGPGDRPAGRLGHERPAGQGLRPPPAAVARLLHRGEGRRGHDPHDQRHREPPAAPPGRPVAARHPGPDHGRHHRHPVRHQRAAGPHHRGADRAGAGRRLDLVQAGLRARLRRGARRDRQRAGRPVREPPRRPHRDRPQPPAPQRHPPPQRGRRLPRRQQLHGPRQRRLRPRHPDAGHPRPGRHAGHRRHHGGPPHSSASARWSPSSCT